MVLRGRGPPFGSLLGPEPALSTVPLACRAPLDHVPMLRAEPPPDATHPPPSRWHLGPAPCSGAAISIHCPRSMGEEAGRAPPTPSPSGRSVGPLLGIADGLPSISSEATVRRSALAQTGVTHRCWWGLF